MKDAKNDAVGYVSDISDKVISAAKAIFSYAELSLQEFKSCTYYCDVLAREGFDVKRGTAGIETAFTASFGSGRPVIGIMAEYDALSSLSQMPGCMEKRPVTEGGNGHGCGHNLLGAGCLGAALAVKHWLESTKSQGTVVLYGCPGEEGGAAKAFMAREHEFDKLDAAIAWHPSDNNEVCTGSSNSCIQTQYTFTGIASHASGAPEKGRSALDAVELMNIGIQFLREHMPSTARVHYAVTDAGGRSPNVVQPKATVLYMVRDIEVASAVALQKRVDTIAQAAAMMTETRVEKKFIDGLANLVTNHTLEHLMHANMVQYTDTSYTQEEEAFANALATTYDSSAVTGIAASSDDNLKAQVVSMKKKGSMINSYVCPEYSGSHAMAGSTDCGDVSWECPFVWANMVTAPNAVPGHSWQNVSSSGHSLGFKGALNAARVMAATVIDMMTSPQVLKEAREEFERRTCEGYVCPIPPDAVPAVAD